jgi:HPt (histidine-containing phosphotransfer) domain-containing protein
MWEDVPAFVRYGGCVHYTFNRDLDVVYASSGRAVRGPAGSVGDCLSRLIGVLDREALLRLRSLDPPGRSDVAIVVLRAFEGSAQRWRRRLQLALSDDTAGLVEVVQIVQSFRSAAVIVGASRLARLCVEAERLAQERLCRDLEDALDAIIAESARILAVLAPLRR